MKKIFLIVIVFLSFLNINAQVGKVGVNTTNPQAMLHVKDSSVLFTGIPTLPITPGNTPVSGAGTRLMWYSDKAAFRVGRVTDASWDRDSIGTYSFAAGQNTKAKGNFSASFGNTTYATGVSSFATGFGTNAIGDFSTAMGWGAEASGIRSLAIGSLAIAIGDSSTAIGKNTTASGLNSTAFGTRNTASGSYSTAMGLLTTASGIYSTALGVETNASGSRSIAMGDGSMAIGSISTAMGSGTTASGMVSTAMGNRTNASGVAATAMGFATDAIGNYSLTTGFTSNASGEAATAMGRFTNASGVASTAIGNFTTASDSASSAMGNATIASGKYATAIGNSTEASGNNSTAIGFNTTASGAASTAMGLNSVASGMYATAMGANTRASGIFSTAIGNSTTARSYSSFTIGQYNDSIATSSPSGFIASDPVFIIGNGTSSAARSNALIVLKNGNTGIGVLAPTEKLEISGKTVTTNFQMTSGAALNTIMQGSAGGNATWTNAPSITTLNSVNVNATYYNYLGPQTRYFNIPASGFHLMPVNGVSTVGLNNTTISGGQTLLTGTAGVSARFEAPIHLPEDAIIKGILLYVRDASGTYEVSADLIEVNALTQTVVATVPGTGIAATPNDTNISITGLNVTTNSALAYFLRFNTIEFNGNLRVYNARVTYTVDKAD